MRTHGQGHAAGTLTLIVPAPNDTQARSLAWARAHSDQAVANRHGATLSDEAPTIVWRGPVMRQRHFPMVGTPRAIRPAPGGQR